MSESKAVLNPYEIDNKSKFIVMFPTPTAATRIGLFNCPINIKFNDSINIWLIFFKIDGIVSFMIKRSLSFSVSLFQDSNHSPLLSFCIKSWFIATFKISFCSNKHLFWLSSALDFNLI